MSEIRHIVFDIGHVLLHWDPELPYLDLIPDRAERQHFLQHICSPQWNLEQDRGRDWGDAETSLIKQYPKKEYLIRAYRERWEESVPHSHDGVVEIYLNLIKQGYDVSLLTNFNQETFPIAKAKFPFLAKARAETVSGEVRLIKPDPAIFSHHQTAHGLSADHLVFIDDNAENVRSATDFGWNAIQFAGLQGADKLKAELAAFGVKV